MNSFGQTICLNMIVKDEAPVIRRCLDSLDGFIDTWVIVDTGSSDGTQDIIRDSLAHLPGELIERPWVNFAHNRSEALRYARGKADFVFVIDADEVLAFDMDFELPRLEKHAYHFKIESGGVSYFKTQLVDNRLEWSFRNIVHEYIYSPDAGTEGVLKGVKTLRFPDGARARDPNTYRKDALLLEQALLEEPDNARYVFYLAQSYRDANEPEQAIKHYLRRAEMGEWIEEVWYSLYQVAEIMQRRGDPWPSVEEAYLRAYQTKPDRAGPLYKIGLHYQQQRQFHIAQLFFKPAMEIHFPAHDRLFVEKPVYDYMLAVEYAVSCFYVGDHADAIATNNRLLYSPELPPEAFTQIENNRRFSLDVVYPRQEGVQRENRIVVLVPFRDPGSEFDDLIESLIHQDYRRFVALFIDDGSLDDHSDRLPDDERFVFVREPEPRGLILSALDALGSQAEPDDVVLPLYATDSLCDDGALSKINEIMNESGRAAFYGQHRFSSGHLGAALPVGCAEDFAAYLDAAPLILPAGFRMAALTSFLNGGEYFDGEADEKWIEQLSIDLFRFLGFDDVMFNERPLLLHNVAASPVVEAARSAGKPVPIEDVHPSPNEPLTADRC